MVDQIVRFSPPFCVTLVSIQMLIDAEDRCAMICQGFLLRYDPCGLFSLANNQSVITQSIAATAAAYPPLPAAAAKSVAAPVFISLTLVSAVCILIVMKTSKCICKSMVMRGEIVLPWDRFASLTRA